MLSVNKREVVKRRYEFAIDSPADRKAIYDALFLAEKRLEELEGNGASEYDDALHIDARDDEIVVWFEREDD
jgi:hypothetical protein